MSKRTIPDILTLAEAAQVLGVCERRVEQFAAANGWRRFRISGYPRAAVLAFARIPRRRGPKSGRK